MVKDTCQLDYDRHKTSAAQAINLNIGRAEQPP
jgi:hypothetical protein